MAAIIAAVPRADGIVRTGSDRRRWSEGLPALMTALTPRRRQESSRPACHPHPVMLHDPERHEPLIAAPWDPRRAVAAIERIIGDTEASFSPDRYWPLHPKDLGPGDDPSQISTSLYFGATGVVWALRYLRACGAVAATSGFEIDLALLRGRNRDWLRSIGSHDLGSYLMGDLPIELMTWADAPGNAVADRLASLIEENMTHPARELMWGSPGSLLAACFLHEQSPHPQWAELVRRIAARLEAELRWSDEFDCHYWTQDLYGRCSTYLDGVHGFVATAQGLIRGRDLLDARDWQVWQRRIAETISRTATREGPLANWRVELVEPPERRQKRLMQFCHGAPGFVICLGSYPGSELDELLAAAGEAIWIAGPLSKGSNLCHGTAGNGYAFLKLFERTGDSRWLGRARAFAMHAIAQFEADAARFGQLRYSLWTGDLGLAVYLWDCLRATSGFPTLDVFFVRGQAGTR
jgi:hypothetical protein